MKEYGYIKLKVNSVMGEEIRNTIDVLSDMLVHHPLKEEETECLDMARFYLSRVNREMLFHTIPYDPVKAGMKKEGGTNE